MNCDEVSALLVEYAEQTLPEATMKEIAQSLEHCPECREELAAITQWQNLAKHWHDEQPPSWQAPSLVKAEPWLWFRQWFPVCASSAALVMVAIMFMQQPQGNGVLPVGSTSVTQTYGDLPQLPQATEAAMVERVLQSSKEQRQEEMQALLKVLKAEMDKRSIETEESLRYIITHQVQGQQELDELYRQMEALVTADTETGVSQ